MQAATEFLAETVRGAWLPPFRGEIYEFANCLNLQAGYAVKGFFDIATAKHLVEPFQAIRDPRVRLISIQGGVQTLKSFLEDATIPYWILHDPGDTLFLLDTDPKALRYCSSRLMPLIRSVPEIQRLLLNVDTHDKTKTTIKFHAMKLDCGGLNEGNCQTLSYRYVIVDEAWMSRASGLLRQAMYRVTQYRDTSKCLIIGQGGFEDEDADEIHKETDMRVLCFRCPFCGVSQKYELARLRGEEFPNRALRGTYSGLSWDTNEKTRPAGKWNFEEAGRSAHIRCHECDARIEDRPEVRRQLNDSHHYTVTNPRAPIEKAGFWWPRIASMRIPFADLVIKYLQAKVAADELGYMLELQEFYQKDWGVTWSENMAVHHRPVVSEPYDIKSEWKEEAHRTLIVDCQRDLEKFFYSVFAMSMSGEARELARGTAHSFDELAMIQTEHKVKDQLVFLDCGFEMTRVLRECVLRGHVGQVRVGQQLRKVWLCWTGLKGSGESTFLHVHSKTKIKEQRIYSPRKWYDTSVGTDQRSPRAPYVEFSNLHCKDLLRARRDQDEGVPKLRFLPDTLPNSDPWSHFAQMRSERRKEEFRNGKKTAIWELVKHGRPNHQWDICSMLMCVQALLGIIGNAEAEAEES